MLYGFCIFEKFWKPHQKQSFWAERGLVISTPLLTNNIFFDWEYAACFKFKKYWKWPGFICKDLFKFEVHLVIFIVPESPIFLKWPNDLVVNDLKVGGVLVERFEEKICIGIGVNYFWKNPEVPNAGALFTEVQEEELLKDHAIRWAEKVYESVTKNSFSLERYKTKLQTLGKIVEYPEGRGWAEDINENGSLRIKTTEGKIINLTSPLISEVN